jgi:poly(3-hydroxybutyrate) depolymerase
LYLFENQLDMRCLLLFLFLPLIAQAQDLTEDSVLDITLSWDQAPNGYVYSVEIFVPDDIPPEGGYPVCIALHGNGGNGVQMLESMSNLLDCHIVVAPSGYENSWSICDEDSKGPDVQMLEELIESLKVYDNVNSNRIRLVGSSNGSALVNNFYIQNDDPSVDRVCGIVSQMNEPQFHDEEFHYPASGPNPGADYCGYDTSKEILIGRKYLSICNDNDGLIPFEGGPSVVGVDFIPAEDAIFKIAEVQGFSGSQLAAGGSPIGNPLIFEYVYLDGDVVLLRGNANHGMNSSQREYLKDWLGDCDFSSNTEEKSRADIHWYPNPFTSVLSIDLINIPSTSFELIDIEGQVVYAGFLIEGLQEFDLNALAKGVYILKFNERSKLIVKQ